MNKFYYRFEEKGIKRNNLDGLHDYISYELILYKFPIDRKTPEGVWILDKLLEPKFIRDSWKKKYAHPTIEEAMESYKARKIRQIEINNLWIYKANVGLDLMEKREWVE